MKKSTSVGLGILGVSLLALWIEGGRLLSPERLWDGLQTSLSKSTGMSWHAGHVEMTLFPRPAISITDLQGGLPGSIPFIAAQKTSAKVSLMTLLGHGVSIPSLTFDCAIIAYDGHPLQIRAAMKNRISFQGNGAFSTEDSPVSAQAEGQSQITPQPLLSASFIKNPKISIGTIEVRNSLIKWKNAVIRPGDSPQEGSLPVKNLRLSNLSSAHPSFSLSVAEIAGKREAWGVEGHSGPISDLPDLISTQFEPGKRPPWPFFIKFTFPHRQNSKISVKEDFLSVDGSIPFLGDGAQTALLIQSDLRSLADFQRLNPELSLPHIQGITGQASLRLVRDESGRAEVALSAVDMKITHSKLSLLADIARRLSQDAGEAVQKTASSPVLRKLRLHNLQFRLDEGKSVALIDSETAGKGGNWHLHLALPAGLFSTVPLGGENLYELSVKPGIHDPDARGEKKSLEQVIPAGFKLSGTVSPKDISGALSGVAPVLPALPLGGGWALADDAGRELSILHNVSMSGDFHFTRGTEGQRWKAFVHNGVFSSEELGFTAELEAGPQSGTQQWRLGGNIDVSQAHLLSGNFHGLEKKLHLKALPDAQQNAQAGHPAQNPAAQNAGQGTLDSEMQQEMAQARESAFANVSATAEDITLHAKDFSLDDVIYHNLAGHIVSENGKTFFELTQGIGDNLPLSGRIEIQRQAKKYHLTLHASPVILPSQLLFRLLGLPAVVTGSAELAGNVEGEGKDFEEILSTLTGKAGVSTVDSALKRQVLMDLAGALKPVFSLSRKDIPLRCAGAAVNFNHGRGDLSAFGLEANHLSLTGNGWISPLQKSLSLRLNPQMSYAGQMISSPLEVSGAFKDLKMVSLRSSGVQFGSNVSGDNCTSLLSAARMGVPGPQAKPAEDTKGEKIAGSILNLLGL